jgi:hypothetical protein
LVPKPGTADLDVELATHVVFQPKKKDVNVDPKDPNPTATSLQGQP